MIDWRAEREQLATFMQRMPFQVPLDVPIAQLAAGQKQKLEILKQIYLHSRILILDEPTSVLTPGEADEVLGLLREQVTEGKLSVLMISHKFREVMAFCDEICQAYRILVKVSPKNQNVSLFLFYFSYGAHLSSGEEDDFHHHRTSLNPIELLYCCH